MGFSCGLVGLPNAGKSTLLNALAQAGARVESYPFSTIEANVGFAPVPDNRLDHLSALFPDKKRIPTRLQFVDIAGLVEHASQGEGMGNQFLSEIRTVDAICHVIRCFEDPRIAHVSGGTDPIRDLEIVETELLLKDLDMLQRVAKRLHQEAKGTDRRASARVAAWDRMVESVAAGIPIRDLDRDPLIEDLMKETCPLTAKPILLIANTGDGGSSTSLQSLKAAADERGTGCVAIRGRLEAEVADVAGTEDERSAYLEEYGIKTSGLHTLVRSGYTVLDLITFYTIDGPEVRAWTVPRGTPAPDAGTRVHSDFADRFILAEIMRVEELLHTGDEKKLRDSGRVRRVGHDQVIEDGDIVHFVCS